VQLPVSSARRGHFDAEYEAIIRAETTMTSPLNVCKVGLNEQSILRCCVQIIISKVPLSVLSVDVYLQDQKQPQRGKLQLWLPVGTAFDGVGMDLNLQGKFWSQ